MGFDQNVNNADELLEMRDQQLLSRRSRWGCPSVYLSVRPSVAKNAYAKTRFSQKLSSLSK